MIYLDNAATTMVSEETAELVKKCLTNDYYNPSALYKPAVDVSISIKKARESIASIININPDELVFTSSGTESDNAALFLTRKREGSRIIISSVEHSAIYNSALELANRGFDVQLAPVDRYGRVIREEFEKLLTSNTSLVSVIHVNNETGAINEIEELSKITKTYNNSIIFHSDGVQAFTKVKLNLKDYYIDLYSISGHKINAPKGIAGLYIKKGTCIKPLLYGGGQEKNIRSSTENTSSIIAMQMAANHSTLNYNKYCNTMKQLLQFTANYIVERIPEAIINTNFKYSAPNILSLSVPDVRGEVLMHSLEKYGIIVGIGSACTSKKGIKRIPTALNLPKQYHDGMIRVSINPEISKDDLTFAADMLVKEYRDLSQYAR